MSELRLRDDFPKRLKQARIDKGFSIVELASRIVTTRNNPGCRDLQKKIGASTMRAYESPSSGVRASFPIVKQFSSVLGKPMSYFCEGFEEDVQYAEGGGSAVSDLAELRREVKELRLSNLDLLGKYSVLARDVEMLKMKS